MNTEMWLFVVACAFFLVDGALWLGIWYDKRDGHVKYPWLSTVRSRIGLAAMFASILNEASPIKVQVPFVGGFQRFLQLKAALASAAVPHPDDLPLEKVDPKPASDEARP